MKAMYKYLGDRLTDKKFKGVQCEAVRRADGKCIRSKQGSMLVKFSGGQIAVVIGRRLRKLTKAEKVKGSDTTIYHKGETPGQ